MATSHPCVHEQLPIPIGEVAARLECPWCEINRLRAGIQRIADGYGGDVQSLAKLLLAGDLPKLSDIHAGKESLAHHSATDSNR